VTRERTWEEEAVSAKPSDRILRGRMAPGDIRSNNVHETGRVCANEDCATVLSIYNSTGWCWQHETPHAYVLQAPRKRRKDAKDADDARVA
jgi:hypothetical protein